MNKLLEAWNSKGSLNTFLIFFGLTLSSVAQASTSVNIPEAFEQAQAQEAIILDVRDSVGLGAIVVEGAQWIEFPETADQLPRLIDDIALKLKGKKVYVYCYIGRRAGFYSSELDKRGIESYNAGGFDEWVRAGIPTETLNRKPINN